MTRARVTSCSGRREDGTRPAASRGSFSMVLSAKAQIRR